MPPWTLQQAKGLMKNNPLLLLFRNEELTLEGIQQFYVFVKNPCDKIAVLINLFDLSNKAARGMIFCNTREGVEGVRKDMRKGGRRIAHISGNMTQPERDEIMRKFRQGVDGFRILITSDLLSRRGIDIQQINLVINYDIPEFRNKEQYIHRVGRAGRYGRKGIAISIVHEGNEKELNDFIELKAYFKTEINAMPGKGDMRKLLNEAA